MFFEMFEGWTQKERKAYLKFAWGRTKIPADTDDLEERHGLSYDGDSNSLPVAHTCFFRVDLPRYDNIDIIREKFKVAMEFCGEIDDDGGPNLANEGEGEDYGAEDDESGSDDYGEGEDAEGENGPADDSSYEDEDASLDSELDCE